MKLREVRIAAPSLAAALVLRRNLDSFAPMLVGLRLGWALELDVAGTRLDELRATVQDWLLDLGQPSTVLVVDRVPEAIAVDLPTLAPRTRVRHGRGEVLAATARRRGGKPQFESGESPILR